MKRKNAKNPPSHSPITLIWRPICTPDAIIRLTPLLKSALTALETIVARAPTWGNAFLPTRASIEPFEKVSELVRILGLEDLNPRGPSVGVDVRISREFTKFGEPALALVDGLYFDLFATVWDLKSLGLGDGLFHDGKIPVPSETTMAKLRDIASRYEHMCNLIKPVDSDTTHGPPITKVKPVSRWNADQEIIKTLRAVRHRLTTKELLDEMSRLEMDASESTIKKRLAEMTREGRLDKDPKSGPRGYGLPEWNGSSGS